MKKSSFKTILFSLIFSFIIADPGWDSDGDGVLDNYTDYLNNGSITSVVMIEGTYSIEENDQFAAFVQDTLRGVSVLSQVPDNEEVFGEWAGLLQFATVIYSNEGSGEMLTFKFYDSSEDIIYNISESIEFVADMFLGSGAEPVIFNVCLEDLDEDGICDDIDDCVGAYDEC